MWGSMRRSVEVVEHAGYRTYQVLSGWVSQGEHAGSVNLA
jgi:hypothetical protein